ncbi:MAG: carboxylesterase/lipase family protein [Polyangiales bacterium]
MARSHAWVFSVGLIVCACSPPPAPAMDGGDSAAPSSDAAPEASMDASADDSAVDSSVDVVVATPVSVTTTRGAVVGRESGGVSAFLGVPYAAAPTGALRWRPPAARAAWSEPLDASRTGPACPQSPARDALSGQSYATSEDCLSLNVWTPRASMDGNKPVMVFIHGGGFVNGTGSLSVYDGRALAAREDAVVVTINYRLGQLGFLAHPALRSEQGDGVAGPANYGFLDQQAALRWVRDEIRAFGGDPSNVTIFGESAGSLSVCLHLVAPGSRGLFHKAIGESASCTFFVNRLRETPDPRFESAESLGQRFARALSCDSQPTPADVLACLRAKTAEQVIAAEPRAAELNIRDARYQPTIDGVVIPDRPWTLFRQAMVAPVPTLTGTNRDEATVFSLTTTIANDTQYRAAIRALLPLKPAVLDPAIEDIVTRLYPASAYASAKAAYDDFVGDLVFVCPARAQARFVTAPMGAPRSWLYHFTRENQAGRGLAIGVFHSAELPYVFGNFSRPFIRTAMDAAVSERVMDAWGRFARTGDPNGAGLAPAWPAYTASDDSLYVLDVTPRVERAFRQQKCDAIDRWLSDLDAP